MNVACMSLDTNANFVEKRQLMDLIESGKIDLAVLKEKAVAYGSETVLDIIDQYIINGIPSIGIEPYEDPLNNLDLYDVPEYRSSESEEIELEYEPEDE